jgi:hypothetical protein
VAGSTSECLDDELIIELIQGRLPDDELLSAEEHMTGCADCRMVVAEAAAADAASETTGPTRPFMLPREPLDPAGESLAPGTLVSRYQIQELIGVGGIGAVYAARDPELHRMVALKVLRAPNAPSGDLHARLLREARAMAQLSHPNVVTVHDAGTHRDGVFLAMELVAGMTLRRWLRDDHGLDEIVRIFRAAGEGLAAAHRSGLVHRDFKPENVLVGDDGRVRVTDFGLARPTNWELTGSHRAIGRSWVHSVVTRTGVVAGTPAYMAPEQFAGEAPDPRSDQFSFCVALYEAIYRERPFPGHTLDEVVDSIVHGRLAPPPAGVSVPAALRAVLLRGLSTRPEDRHASMDSLLGELVMPEPVAARARRPRRGLVIGAAGGLAAGAIALTAVLVAGGDPPAASPAPLPVEVTAAPAPREAPAPAPAPAEPIETVTPAEPPPVAEAPRSSPRRSRGKQRPARVVDQPAREKPDVRVGDGLREPFGGN